MALTQVSSGLISSVANTAITGNIAGSQIAPTAVTPGTYGATTQHAVITVDQQGRITSAANATPSIANTQITGVLGVSQGGTNSTATPTAGGVGYGTGTAQAYTSAGTSGQALVSAGSSAPAFGTLGISGGGTNSTSTPTSGAVAYGTGTAIGYTAAGSSGQVLTSAGSGSPTWSTPSAGAMTLLSTTALTSGAAAVSITSGFSSTYDDYFIILDSIATLNSDQLAMMFYRSSSMVSTTTYNMTLHGGGSSGFSYGGQSGFLISGSTSTSPVLHGHVWISGANSGANSRIMSDVTVGTPTAFYHGWGNETTTGNVTGIEFHLNSGASYTFSSGNIRLYGVQKS